jgi:uncharacterized repeat protein (TIGR03847 family)
MSRITITHNPVERFATGTVGAPGERTFFIQIRSASGLSSVVLEKSQVAALTDRLKRLIRELRSSESASIDELSVVPVRDNQPLDFPVEEDFRVGIIGISWDEEVQRIGIQIQAIAEDIEEEITELLDDDQAESIENAPDLILASLRIHQIRTFVERSEIVISSGREVCPFCGLPINIDGHLCPRANGYRR